MTVEVNELIHEIENLHKQINHDQLIKVVVNNMDVIIAKDDIIHTTPTGMVRIVRANGNITSINPEFIVLCCIVRRGAYL